MTIKVSTGLRNGMMDSASFQDTFNVANEAEIRVYGGAVPADADAAIGGATLLATIKNGANYLSFSEANNGTVGIAAGETWSGLVSNSGAIAATFYRLVLHADDGSASTTAKRVQGSVGTAGADLNISSAAPTNGSTQAIDLFQVTMPAA